MRSSALAFVLLAACGGLAGPPRGPHHDPVNSPDAATKCPTQRDAARAAREAGLDDPSAAARQRTAQAVLDHAACEGDVFAAWVVAEAPQEQLLVELRQLREQYDTAHNLYAEVAASGLRPLAVAADVKSAQLAVRFGEKLAIVPPPSDLGARPRALFRTELEELVASFAGEAELSAREAISLGADDEALAELVGQACAVIGQVDPRGRAAEASCAGR